MASGKLAWAAGGPCHLCTHTSLHCVKICKVDGTCTARAGVIVRPVESRHRVAVLTYCAGCELHCMDAQ